MSLAVLNALSQLTDAEIKALARVDPALYAAYRQRVEAEEKSNEKELCEDSLIEFLIHSWQHMGEPEGLSINWHHEIIADYLEAQARGELPAMIINQPPRTTKSLLCSVALPAWIWCQPQHRWGPLIGPHVQFFCLSYGATLAEEIAVKHRRLILGEWYQGHWGHQVKLLEDQRNRANFQTTAGGGRISNSIEGGILGRGGIWQIIDDPHHTRGAESDVQRRDTLDGMRALVTRINNPQKAARTLIMQRLHQDDATNYALEHWGRRVKHIMFPMRFDPARAIREDPRKIDQELLWADVWNEEAVKQEETELGEYGTAGQLQQSPIPHGGGIIKSEWWRLWPDDAEREAGFVAVYKCYFCNWESQKPPMGNSIPCPMCGMKAERKITYPDTSYRMLFVDTAYSEKDQVKNSWNAVTRWGIWHDKNDSPRAMLMEMWRGRVPLRGGTYDQRDPWEKRPEKGLVEIVHEMATKGQCDLVLIEKKTRGVDLNHELERLLRPWPYTIDFFEPTGRGDKVARLTACQSLFTNELIWAPDKQWARVVIDEVSAIPRGQFDDIADTVSGSLLYLREMGLLTLRYEFDDERRRASVFSGRKESVRDMYEEA